MMPQRLTIIADENIPKLDVFLADIADVRYLAGREIVADDLQDADALLVRSVTKVDKPLLAKANKLKFVGSCTIGTDHIAQDYLAANNIAFAHAPGCNAEAVVDYVLAAILHFEPKLNQLVDKKAVVIGYGQVGSRLVARLSGLGLQCKIIDPFKPEHNACDNDVADADFISLHVPLTHDGEHPTKYLFDQQKLQLIKPNAVLINSSRGPVIDNNALLEFLKQKSFRCVLDVYEDEPSPSVKLLDQLELATGHIAGYSSQGKVRGTMMVLDALTKCFDLSLPQLNVLDELQQTIQLEPQQSVLDVVKLAYDIQQDSESFKQLYKAADIQNQASAFDAYRKNYPVRCEWSQWQLSNVSTDQKSLLKKSGFVQLL